jgi:hypothetical protein
MPNENNKISDPTTVLSHEVGILKNKKSPALNRAFFGGMCF